MFGLGLEEPVETAPVQLQHHVGRKIGEYVHNRELEASLLVSRLFQQVVGQFVNVPRRTPQHHDQVRALVPVPDLPITALVGEPKRDVVVEGHQVEPPGPQFAQDHFLREQFIGIADDGEPRRLGDLGREMLEDRRTPSRCRYGCGALERHWARLACSSSRAIRTMSSALRSGRTWS